MGSPVLCGKHASPNVLDNTFRLLCDLPMPGSNQNLAATAATISPAITTSIRPASSKASPISLYIPLTSRCRTSHTLPAMAQRPTCTGLRIRSTTDCNVIFHAVSLRILPMVSRRLSVDERRAIQSGCVFVWEERSPTIEAIGVRGVSYKVPYKSLILW